MARRSARPELEVCPWSYPEAVAILLAEWRDAVSSGRATWGDPHFGKRYETLLWRL